MCLYLPTHLIHGRHALELLIYIVSLSAFICQVHTLQAIALMEFNFNSTAIKGSEVSTAQGISKRISPTHL